MKAATTFSSNLSSDFTANAVAPCKVAAAFLFVVFISTVSTAQTSPIPAPVVDRSINSAPGVTKAAAVPATSAAVSIAAPQKSFVTIGDKPAILYDAPSTRANKTFIILRNSPLEVLVRLDKWTKVREAGPTFGWVENDTLTTRRHVQVNVALADVRSAADAASTLVFQVQRNVLLEISSQSTAIGWLAVKHRDGQQGFIKLTDVWGG